MDVGITASSIVVVIAGLVRVRETSGIVDIRSPYS